MAHAARIDDNVTVEEVVRDSLMHEYGHVVGEFLKNHPDSICYKLFNGDEDFAESFAAYCSGGWDIPHMREAIDEYRKLSNSGHCNGRHMSVYKARGISGRTFDLAGRVSKETQEEIDSLIEDYDHGDVIETFKAFWTASIERRLDEFDFDDAFDLTTPYIGSHLAMNGLGDPDLSMDYMEEEVREILPKRYISALTVENPWIYYNEDDVVRDIAEIRCRMYRNNLGDLFSDMEDLYKKLVDRDSGIPLSEQAILFDEVINCVHQNGSVFEDVIGSYGDVDEIREEVEELYK